MNKNIFLIVFIIVLLSDSYAQKRVIFIEDNIRTGYIVNNFLGYDSFPKLKPLFINEIKVGHKTIGTKPWHSFYNYPDVGISFINGNLGNRRQFGKIYTLVPNITFDFKTYNKAKIQTSFGWGLAYFTKPYDSISNPHNILIGSHITHTAFIQLNYLQQIGKGLFLQVGGAYIHASNGHYQVPNGGLNLATLNIGIKKYFNNYQPQKIPENIEIRTNWDLSVVSGIGLHEFAGTLFPVGTPKYTIYTTSVFAGKYYKYWGKFFTGFSGKFYTAYLYNITKDTLFTENIMLKSSVLTVFLANEFQFGHFAIYTQGGINFYKPFVKKYVYHYDEKFNIDNLLELYISTKLAMKYYFFDPQVTKFNIFVQWAIKANFGNADFTEVSAGFSFITN